MQKKVSTIRDINELTGRDLTRVWNLSDSVFAFAMTLLALHVHLPDRAAIHSEAELLAGLARDWPRLATYLLSFLTLGLFWLAQQTQLDQLAGSDRNATWLHLAFLAVIVLMPFSTELLSGFITYRTAMLVYWLNILACGLLMLAAWNYLVRAGLLKPEVGADTIAAIQRRIVLSQGLYAFAAALCVFGTVWSIGFALLVQLYYATAAPIPWLKRLYI